MKLKQLIEITDKILPYKLNKQNNNIIATFKSNNILYNVWVTKNDYDDLIINGKKQKEPVYELGFQSEKSHSFSPSTMNIKTNVFEVMATVKDIFKKWLKKNKPKYISFSISDFHKSRYNIYKKMLSINYKEIKSNDFEYLFKRIK